jgi:hypothetical protein
LINYRWYVEKLSSLASWPKMIHGLREGGWGWTHTRTMVLVYKHRPKLGHFVRVNVGKSSSSMEHLGMVLKIPSGKLTYITMENHHF